jgi:NAD-dependent DNA ligase
MIKKTGDQYTVYSETGKRLSKPSSKKSAKKLLQQIKHCKHQDMDKS